VDVTPGDVVPSTVVGFVGAAVERACFVVNDSSLATKEDPGTELKFDVELGTELPGTT